MVTTEEYQKRIAPLLEEVRRALSEICLALMSEAMTNILHELEEILGPRLGGTPRIPSHTGMLSFLCHLNSVEPSLEAALRAFVRLEQWCHADPPPADPDAEAWLRRQLGNLETGQDV